jgi:hypothetical protein
VNQLNIFEAADYVLIRYGLPILKRKFFQERRTTQERIQNVYRYLRQNTEYDASWVQKKIARLYGIDIVLDEEDWKEVQLCEVEYQTVCYSISEEEIQQFFRQHKKVYFFGTGLFALCMWNRYRKKANLCGFVKSKKDGEESFHGLPVLSIEELQGDEAIFVTLTQKYQEEVRESLREFETLYVY